MSKDGWDMASLISMENYHFYKTVLYTKLSQWVQTDAHGRIVGENENCTDPKNS